LISSKRSSQASCKIIFLLSQKFRSSVPEMIPVWLTGSILRVCTTLFFS
jgi:hypothetical protein